MDSWIYAEEVQSGWTNQGTIAYVMTPYYYSSAPMGSKKYKRGYYDGGSLPSRADHMRNDWSDSSFCCGYVEGANAHVYMYDSKSDYPTPDLDVTYIGYVPSTVPYGGGSYTVRVVNDGDGTLKWYRSGRSWIDASPSGGSVDSVSDYNSVTITVAPNTSSSSRSGNITFYNQDDTGDYENISIYQEGQPEGDVQVSIDPSEACDAGAQWNLDGGSWRTSGTTQHNISVGNHTIYFKSVSGWNSPSSISFYVNPGQVVYKTGVYTKQTGNIRLYIQPSAADTAGALWKVDGRSWRRSGEVESGLDTGNQTVLFDAPDGWEAPSPMTVYVSNGQTSTETANFAKQTGSIRITIQPQGANDAGAR